MRINYKEVSVATACPFCGHANFVEVNENDLFDYEDGGKAQDCFPYLTANEREALISGICPACWDKMWKE